jgi:hypothetical protein
VLVLTLLLLTFMGERAARRARSAESRSMSPLLDVQGLRVAFAGREVVHGIDFHIARARSWRWAANRGPARR